MKHRYDLAAADAAACIKPVLRLCEPAGVVDLIEQQTAELRNHLAQEALYAAFCDAIKLAQCWSHFAARLALIDQASGGSYAPTPVQTKQPRRSA